MRSFRVVFRKQLKDRKQSDKLQCNLFDVTWRRDIEWHELRTPGGIASIIMLTIPHRTFGQSRVDEYLSVRRASFLSAFSGILKPPTGRYLSFCFPPVARFHCRRSIT